MICLIEVFGLFESIFHLDLRNYKHNSCCAKNSNSTEAIKYKLAYLLFAAQPSLVTITSLFKSLFIDF